MDRTFHQFVDVDNEFNFIFSAGYVTLCVGVVVSAVGALGLCGTFSDSICILVTVRTRSQGRLLHVNHGANAPWKK